MNVAKSLWYNLVALSALEPEILTVLFTAAFIEKRLFQDIFKCFCCDCLRFRLLFLILFAVKCDTFLIPLKPVSPLPQECVSLDPHLINLFLAGYSVLWSWPACVQNDELIAFLRSIWFSFVHSDTGTWLNTTRLPGTTRTCLVLLIHHSV